MKIYILFLFVFFASKLPAQVSLDDINTRRNTYSRNGMIALNTWATANIISGTVGVFTAKNAEIRHFHEMNIYWNMVNLGIAIPGLISAIKEKKTGLSLQQTIKKQHGSETAFLVNGFLDISYITTGFLLREIGKGKTDKLRDRLCGYGDSMIVQGGFLMFFDFVKYALHKRNGKRIDTLWQNTSIAPYGAYGLGLSMVKQF